MQDVLLVDELDALADLPHEDGAALLGEDEVVVDDPLEQLTTLYSVT